MQICFYSSWMKWNIMAMLFFRAIYDPISKKVESLFHPTLSDDDKLSKEDNIVCGLLYLNMNLCKKIESLLDSPMFSDGEIKIDLFNDILEVLCTNCTRENYLLNTKSNLSKEMKTELFEELFESFNLSVIETNSSLNYFETKEQYRTLQTTLFSSEKMESFLKNLDYKTCQSAYISESFEYESIIKNGRPASKSVALYNNIFSNSSLSTNKESQNQSNQLHSENNKKT